MRSRTSTLHCDGEDGFCERWDMDYYHQCASSVGNTRITATTRAPGWASTDFEDFCPEHAPAAGSAS